MKAIAIGIGRENIIFDSVEQMRKHFHLSSMAVSEYQRSGEPLKNEPYCLDALFEGVWTEGGITWAEEYHEQRQAELAR